MRTFDDWITAYSEYASHTEAPPHMNYWAGVSAVAGALGRKVWFDQIYYRWFPNFYIVFVGPPDVVKKTTTMKIAVDLLKQIPGFRMGPGTTTWQALIKEFKSAEEEVEIAPGVYETLSQLYTAAGELGNFLDPQDTLCMDRLVDLWDGSEIKKVTKTSGSEEIENPIFNLIGCCTPKWIEGSVPAYMVDGGLLSRIIFLYGDKRGKRVALPGLSVPKNIYEVEAKLVEDLTEISNLRGDCTLTPDSIRLIEDQYNKICDEQEENLDGAKILQRKQVQIIKLSMVLAASKNSVKGRSLFLTPEILEEAWEKVEYLTEQRSQVFNNIGKNKDYVRALKIISIVKKAKKISIRDLYSSVFEDFPRKEEFKTFLASAQSANFIRTEKNGSEVYVLPGKKDYQNEF